MKVDFTKGGGLVPAIIQEAVTKNVLMLGYMNEESLAKTLETKKVTFWSRSRNTLWTKGETSGNFLDLVDIKDKANRYPAELSAGEQQRVGIARALVNKPRVLICDEPTGNLDPITAMEIMGLLEQINVRGTTVLMVTHAKDIVDKMNKRVVAIDHVRIVRDEEGSYGFSQRGIIDDPYDPSVPSFATDESSKAKTLQLDAEL